MRKLILIDGNALVHRAFHALPPTLMSPKGVLTNAVYGFVSVLLKMLKELKPDYVAATFDLAAPTFRHEEFAEYKSQRVKAPDELYAQIPLVKEILTALGMPIYEKEGFEADDLIGTLAEKSKNIPNLQTIIATGDLDTLQLVTDDKVVVFTLRKGMTDTFTYDEKEVKKRFSGLLPGQMTDYKGLKGDPSDNIPGVPGIGEKTATTLLGKYGSIENLYGQLSKPKKPKDISPKLAEKLLENKDQAFFSKKLATIIRDVPADFSLEKAEWKKNIERDKLEKLLKELGFYSLVKRFAEIDGSGEAVKAAPAAVSLFSETDIGPKIIETKNAEEAVHLAARLKKKGNFSFILSAGQLNLYPNEGSEIFSLPASGLPASFKEILEDSNVLKTGHDLKETVKFLFKNGIHLKGVEFDTALAAYLLNSDLSAPDFNKIYFAEFSENPSSDERRRPFFIFQLKKRLWEKLKTENLNDVLEDIELPLIAVLAEMETAGIKIDSRGIGRLSEAVSGQIISLEKEIYKSAGEEFNINSPQQLARILFEVLKLKGKVRKTGKGALSTAAAELEKLSEEHPIADLILKYRELQKLKTTYIKPFPALLDKKTGRLHTSYNQFGTATGRLSSQNPNLQNIPVRTELGREFRKVFIAEKGFKLLSLDYSQLELRVVAHISKDEKMIKAFKAGEDIHTRTAAEIFDVPSEKVTADMRRDAKTLNFGVLYGMGLLGFQRAAGVTRERAREFINEYMEDFAGVARYTEETKKTAHQKEFVATIFGRKRQLREINANMPELVRQAERMAINMPVQGTAADLIKMAMSKIAVFLHKNYDDNEVKMLLQVHDELLFEIRTDLVQKLSEELRDIMENVYQLSVPLTVDIKCGDNWSEMHSLSANEK